MRCAGRIVVMLALGVCADCSRVEPLAGRGRGVLLIAVDGLRADHVSCYGYDRDTTPEIDALASEGVRFDAAFSCAPWSLPAGAALLSGCDPLIALRNLPRDLTPSIALQWHLPEAAPHLAQELLSNGYETAAFLDNPLLGSTFGFARGFQEFQGADPDLPTVADAQGTPGVIERFRRWLDECERDANWFAFVQISALERTWLESDPSWDSYFAPRAALSDVPPVADAGRVWFAIPRRRWSGGTRTLGEYEAKYDGALRKLDGALGRLFDDLRHNRRYDDTTIVLVSHCGVGLGEAGLYLDSGVLADVDLRVPLVVKPTRDGVWARGATARSLASLLDVAPTVLALERIPAPSDSQGVSLVPALEGGDVQLRNYAFARCGYQEGIAVMDARWCYERTEPWRAVDRGLVFSWYGGPPPLDPQPREVLHDRASDRSVGHAHSAPLDSERIAALRAAAARWDADVERLRRRVSPAEWVDGPAAGAAAR